MDKYEKKLKDALQDEGTDYEVKAWIRRKFPELCESEDERIRKEIINYFECQKRDEPTRAATLDRWIAYLDKQKE